MSSSEGGGGSRMDREWDEAVAVACDRESIHVRVIITSASRRASRARKRVVHALRACGWTLAELGARMGHRDHTTVSRWAHETLEDEP